MSEDGGVAIFTGGAYGRELLNKEPKRIRVQATQISRGKGIPGREKTNAEAQRQEPSPGSCVAGAERAKGEEKWDQGGLWSFLRRLVGC